MVTDKNVNGQDLSSRIQNGIYVQCNV